MDPIEEILSQIPMGQLAEQLGTDEASAEQAARQAVPALLGGLQANAQDSGGAASLTNALSQHTGMSLEGLDLGAVDTADGEAIVGNVFGDNTDQVINKLGGQSGGAGIMSKLLPILAPLVMSWLAGKFFGQGQTSAAPAGGGGDLGDLLGGATGGTGGLGDLLGGLLGGGGGSAGASDPLGDLLGGLLGGGKKS
ncbi:MAG: DUF937 domain-containing protein [Acidimicrobiia bacterium]